MRLLLLPRLGTLGRAQLGLVGRLLVLQLLELDLLGDGARVLLHRLLVALKGGNRRLLRWDALGLLLLGETARHQRVLRVAHEALRRRKVVLEERHNRTEDRRHRGHGDARLARLEGALENAAERFLDRPTEQIGQIAKETLEANLRGVLATLSPEEVNEDRLKFAERLSEEAGVLQALLHLGELLGWEARLERERDARRERRDVRAQLQHGVALVRLHHLARAVGEADLQPCGSEA